MLLSDSEVDKLIRLLGLPNDVQRPRFADGTRDTVYWWTGRTKQDVRNARKVAPKVCHVLYHVPKSLTNGVRMYDITG